MFGMLGHQPTAGETVRLSRAGQATARMSLKDTAFGARDDRSRILLEPTASEEVQRSGA